jgi:hypothetical protein
LDRLSEANRCNRRLWFEHRTLTTAQGQPVIHNRWETVMEPSTHVAARKTPWNKGKLVGQKAPLKLKDI